MLEDPDFTPVWEALNSGHVLLLVDTHFSPDPSKEDAGTYDIDVFESRLETVHEWFLSVISEVISHVDFRMKNNAILSVRPLLPIPGISSCGTKVMVLR